MIVYVDSILLVNFIMDLAIFTVTAWSAGRRCQRWRLLLGAALASVYSLSEVYAGWSAAYSLPVRIVLSVALVRLVFGRQTLTALGRLVACFYAVSFLLGGAVLACVPLLPYYWPLVAGCIVGMGAAVLAWRVRTAVGRTKSLTYTIHICDQDRSVTCTALLDTGNQLHSLGQQNPVLLVETAALQGLLSRETQAFLTQYQQTERIQNLANCRDARWRQRTALIPFHSVGGDGLLLGFRPDRITVYRAMTVCGVYQDILLGLYEGTFSRDGQFQALLPAQMQQQVMQRAEEVGLCAV